jgi:hypothetical protein
MRLSDILIYFDNLSQYGMEMNLEKKVMRISWQPFPVWITTDQTQLKNVEYLKYYGSM